jgi:hypothetical protein
LSQSAKTANHARCRMPRVSGKSCRVNAYRLVCEIRLPGRP